MFLVTGETKADLQAPHVLAREHPTPHRKAPPLALELKFCSTTFLTHNMPYYHM